MCNLRGLGLGLGLEIGLIDVLKYKLSALEMYYKYL